MTDLRPTIIPKSDQLNSDDLIGGPLTIKVTKVSLCTEPEQPIAISYEGDNSKPFKPCKSMRRVMVTVWGPDGNAYAGRRMTLYRDEKVTFGAMAVGGIRISHMSNIDREMTMALTASKASRKPFTVRPLKDEPAATKAAERPSPPADDTIDAPTLTGPTSDWADALDAQLDTLAGAEVAPVFNPATKTAEWAALREGDPVRAEALKQKARDRAGAK
jgi:hypothetical protein